MGTIDVDVPGGGGCVGEQAVECWGASDPGGEGQTWPFLGAARCSDRVYTALLSDGAEFRRSWVLSSLTELQQSQC